MALKARGKDDWSIPTIIDKRVRINDKQNVKDTLEQKDNGQVSKSLDYSVPHMNDNWVNIAPKTLKTSQITVNSEYINTLPKLGDDVDATSFIVFDYYETNIFTLVTFKENLINSIIENIVMKYSSANKELLLSKICDLVDTIKNDNAYPDGPFIIKINDSTFELYEKVTESVINRGYLFSSTSKNVLVKKIGRYGVIKH